MMHAAPLTFERRSDAERWLTLLEGRIIRGEWSSPEGARLVLAAYAARWIRERQLQPRTRELYESQLRNHINPYLGSRALDKINAQTIPHLASRLAR